MEHAYFVDCAAFCECWDQTSFDPDYNVLPMTLVAPMVPEVFSRPVYKDRIVMVGVKEALADDKVARERADTQ